MNMRSLQSSDPILNFNGQIKIFAAKALSGLTAVSHRRRRANGVAFRGNNGASPGEDCNGEVYVRCPPIK
jgi:hypothetical protein